MMGTANSFKRFDHGEEANFKKYGNTTAPEYNLKLLNFPLAVLSGSQDGLAYPNGVAWLMLQLKDILIFDHEYYMNHLSPIVGKDMSMWTVDTMAILNHYNGVCDEST